MPVGYKMRLIYIAFSFSLSFNLRSNEIILYLITDTKIHSYSLSLKENFVDQSEL